MNRRDMLGAMGGGLIGMGLNVNAFGALIEEDELKVGDIVECTVSWVDTERYINGGVCKAFHKRFMGERFENGGVKRFKLLESYDFGEALFTPMDTGILVYPILQDINTVCYYGSTMNPTYPTFKRPEELTLHNLIGGRAFGSLTTKTQETIKWSKYYGDRKDYHAEKNIKATGWSYYYT